MTFDDGYHSVLENVSDPPRARYPKHHVRTAQHVGPWLDHRSAAPGCLRRLMTPDELREMQKHGTPIGSHGMTHRALTRISQAEMAAELADSENARGHVGPTR